MHYCMFRQNTALSEHLKESRAENTGRSASLTDEIHSMASLYHRQSATFRMTDVALESAVDQFCFLCETVNDTWRCTGHSQGEAESELAQVADSLIKALVGREFTSKAKLAIRRLKTAIFKTSVKHQSFAVVFSRSVVTTRSYRAVIIILIAVSL